VSGDALYYDTAGTALRRSLALLQQSRAAYLDSTALDARVIRDSQVTAIVSGDPAQWFDADTRRRIEQHQTETSALYAQLEQRLVDLLQPAAQPRPSRLPPLPRVMDDRRHRNRRMGDIHMREMLEANPSGSIHPGSLVREAAFLTQPQTVLSRYLGERWTSLTWLDLSRVDARDLAKQPRAGPIVMTTLAYALNWMGLATGTYWEPLVDPIDRQPGKAAK
jgi:hypothetical protein